MAEFSMDKEYLDSVLASLAVRVNERLDKCGFITDSEFMDYFHELIGYKKDFDIDYSTIKKITVGIRKENKNA